MKSFPDFENKSILYVIYKYFASKGACATILFRISSWFYRHKMIFLAHMVHNHCIRITGCDINEGAIIGKRLDIRHPVGIVIGGGVNIGDDFAVLSGVTIGAIDRDRGGGHVNIGNNVYCGSGAKLIGNFTIGNNVKIGANAVVLSDAPDNVTLVGIPAKNL